LHFKKSRINGFLMQEILLDFGPSIFMESFYTMSSTAAITSLNSDVLKFTAEIW